jgi:opacity protein-like surface antigen
MKKTLIFLTAVLVLVPGFMFSDVVTFKVGYFFPRADSDLWQDEFDNMMFTKTGFQDSNFGFGYEYFLSNQLSVVFNVEGYSKNKLGQYENFVGETIDDFDYAFDYGQGFSIVHTFSVSITPIQLSLKIAPLGRRQKIIPYVGGGAGLYIWNVRMWGDLILMDEYEEFDDPNLNQTVKGYYIVPVDAREENKLKVGFHAFGGIMVPVANKISFEAEFKYNFAKGELTEAFEGFEPFDLSGYQISVGLNYWF